ncbi:E3 ubiquitin-protein ligase UPL5-like [Impatiens glandulifera]|uniref:E3 ubiquitin-protein ligase UPL5-like n=1 Tax=Impatiens glandulifera TaxID=253017 RepID=UPI001FB0C7AC|nr:E3 ubiquitin-protein ligase UPL5-like [Impatiens glandulifera]
MSPVEPLSGGGGGADSLEQRLLLDRISSKRKLDDYGPADEDALSSDLVTVRMRKDESNAVDSSDKQQQNSPPLPPLLLQLSQLEPRAFDARLPTCSSNHSPQQQQQQQDPPSNHSLPPVSSRIQFFVRMIPRGNTLVLHGNSDDTVKSVHQTIESITGIPLQEQRLIYSGKQLQWDQSLSQCIEKDAGLQLVARLKSTHYPRAWQVIDDLISIICRLCKGELTSPSRFVKSRMMEFLNITAKSHFEAAQGHLRVFISSDVPSALLMLYTSPRKGNRECAEGSIRQFLNSCRTVMPLPLQPLCAPIVLEFCKLLGRTSHDSLYFLCRSSLGSMVERVGIGGGHELNEIVTTAATTTTTYPGRSGTISMQDIFPFFKELADRLSSDLLSTMEHSAAVGLLLSDINDFIAFLLPLRTAMSLGNNPCSIPFDEENCNLAYYSGEIRSLHDIFIDLLGKIDQCLQKMEERLAAKETSHLPSPGWSHYLTILKELHGISKLYRGADEHFWENMRKRKAAVRYLIVNYAKRDGDNNWFLERKEMTDFECRRHLTLLMLPELKDEYEELHEMLIDRSHLLAESFEYLAHADAEALRGGLFMEFKNEEATGPGVLREWFLLVCQAIFNPENALFVACPNDRRRFYPNPASKVDPLHLDYFTFAGRVIALALMYKVHVGIVLDRVFLSQLAGNVVSLEDIKDADPLLYSSYKKILEMESEIMDSEELGLTFVQEIEELGMRKTIELCHEGKNRGVNSRNREEYIKLLIEHNFVKCIEQQVEHFSGGFSDIMCDSKLKRLFFKSLEVEDLDLMLHGSGSEICVDDWEAHTEYNGYKESDPQINWFWKILRGMLGSERRILLLFWTSVKYLPVEGFGGLGSRLYIYKTRECNDHLPSSHTCFYRLCFPPYPSMDVMKDRLRIITQDHVGSSFGTW